MPEYLLPLLTVFSSGVFALLVALTTGYLANLKDFRAHNRALTAKRYEVIEQLYAETLAIFEKAIRYTKNLQSYSELTPDLSRINGRLLLVAPKEVMEQSESAGDLLFKWSTEYRQGAPKQLGDTGMAIISSNDSPHQKAADEIFPRLNHAVVELAQRMKAHIESIKDGK